MKKRHTVKKASPVWVIAVKQQVILLGIHPLRRRIAELEDLVRGLTQQLVEVLRSSGGQRSPPLAPEGPKANSKKSGRRNGNSGKSRHHSM